MCSPRTEDLSFETLDRRDGLDVRIVSEDGELLRELVLDPSKSYQALGRS
jgi:hypothetical protein